MNTITTETGQELNQLYFDYLNQAKVLTKGMRQHLFQSPYFLLSAALLLVNFWGLCYGLTATRSIESRNIAAYAIWLWVPSIPLTLIGSIKAQNWVKEQAVKVSQSKRGFEKFFDLYNKKRWWPQKMVTGKKYEQFLSIIGR